MPLYRQLHQHFRELIGSGRLVNGERLPATRELAGMLGLNRTTVSAAYALLETDGLINAQVGRGSFVTAGYAPEPASLNWDRLLEETDILPVPAPVVGKGGISFVTSRPAELLFPLDAFRSSCEEVLRSPELMSILQLGSPNGYEPLRHYLFEEARRQGATRPGDDLLITSGCQQALDLIGRAMLRPGDKVAVEDPVYPGLKNLLAQAGATLLGIPVGEDGIELDTLQRVIEREQPKLLVVTPNFQNPTGATLPAEARAALLRITRKAGVVVVENDIYGELRYAGPAIPCLKQLDEGGVVLVRSFSKVAFPGLRVGWIIGPRPLAARLAQIKQLSDLHTDQFSQAVLLRFAQAGHLETHRRRILEAGAERLAAVLEGCELHLPRGTQYTRPRGGMNLWVRLPDPLDAAELLPRAQHENVAYLPGKYFTVARRQPGALRLSFAGLTPAEIQKGLAVLGEIFSSELERTQAAGIPDPGLAMV